jgi:hypothetical protein
MMIIDGCGLLNSEKTDPQRLDHTFDSLKEMGARAVIDTSYQQQAGEDLYPDQKTWELLKHQCV